MSAEKYIVDLVAEEGERLKTLPFHFHSLLLSVLVLACGLQARTASAQCDSPSFDGSRSYSALGGTQSGASAVATGDFNGDGRADLAVATPETNGVSIFLNNGDGTFGSPVPFATGRFPNYVAVADFNGDGKPDLITANTGENSVSILLGNGNGTFQSAQNFTVGIFPSSIAVGDFNGDGKIDVAVGGGSSGIGTHELWVLLGNGDGTLQNPIGNTMTDYQYFVVAGDFNGDGNLDLVTGSSTDLWILIGNGDGTFDPPLSIATTGVGPYGNSVAVGDFNSDGKLDLAVTNSAQQVNSNVPGTVSILLGNGNGTFLPPLLLQTGIFPYSVRAADFNEDGRLDLAVANAGDARISIFTGNGDGTFQSATHYPVGANWTTTAAVADFNGDGKPDVAVSSAFSDNVSVLLSRGDGTFHDVATYGAGTQPYAIATGDFNHDGNLDLAVADSGTGAADPGSSKVSVLLGNGDGSFGAAVNYAVGKLPSSVAAADLNGDGNLDLAVVNHQDGNISILLGNGDGTFQTAVNYPAGTNAISLVVADFNNDSKLDLAVGSLGASNANQVSVLLGNGNGTFEPAVNSTVPGTGLDAISGGDFNGDGKLDLAVANYNSSNVVIMMGNGDGTFQSAPNAVGALGPVSVAVGDFNGDGKADLAVGNYFLSKVSVSLGNGDGTFQSPTYYGVGNDPLGIAIADLNGDSKPDLAVVNVNDHYVSILQGGGNGTFEEAVNYGTSKGPSAVVAADFNGDGKPDLAMTGYWFNNVSILLNICTAPPIPTSAVSRKMHDTAGTFDIDLPLIGDPGIESRNYQGPSSGRHQIVIAFANPVTVNGTQNPKATLTAPKGGSVDTVDVSNSVVTVDLRDVGNEQTITLTLLNVSDGMNSGNVVVPMGVLLGDVNANRLVNSTDTSVVQAQSGKQVTITNFRTDVNTNGLINSTDTSIVQSKSGTGLP